MSGKFLRMRLHRLVDKFSDEELENACEVMLGLYCDRMILNAMQEAKEEQQPWDMLTHEEAVRMLG